MLYHEQRNRTDHIQPSFRFCTINQMRSLAERDGQAMYSSRVEMEMLQPVSA